MQKVKLGFIGTGPRGQGVIKQSLKEPRIELKWICDKYEKQLQKGYEAAGETKAKTCLDHRLVLDDPDVDSVYICVEPHKNVGLVIEALKAGKHVMCDVPLSLDIEECWQLVVAVENSGKIFQLGEQVRYRPFTTAWKNMYDNNELGKILFIEGQYLHTRSADRYFQDAETGDRVSWQYALENPQKVVRSRIWSMPHPILYLPHELSPFLYILNERITRVSCMGTGLTSHVHDWFDRPDFECAVMHTENNTVLRMAAGFTAPITQPYHWYHMWGTKGRVETQRYSTDKMKMWFGGQQMNAPAELMWEFDPLSTPAEALSSGHDGADYYPWKTFADAVLDGTEPHLGIYQAVETAAPAIIAAMSAEKDGECMSVPDFRPNEGRQFGKMPQSIGY